MSSHPLAPSATAAARRARRSGTLQGLARGGYVASGVLHLLLGWLAVRLALGTTGGGAGQADQEGALRQLAAAPGGAVLLWLAVAGFAALALWQLTEALMGVPAVATAKQAGARGKAAAKAVLYGVLAATAVRVATGASGGGSEEGLTAELLRTPVGRWSVAAAGAIVVGVGVFHVVKGWRKTFLDDLRGTGGGAVGDAVVRLGLVGYVAKGVALGVLGGLFVAAALTADPEKAGGLDDALRTIRDQPFGTVLLVVTGLGIAAYGVYSFARARYARM
ncbi:DUF1206 domain-containing protein [Isoptericola sp. 4D.3]|uniref:DUF1206 domain-containing protein n=1 Tax=Isoptericola peretonis TaxID=2918523 RepID=A0ABT0J0E9_9MICO|nr:DUF1206 domain-containing protein [Isoptericola sp. 4D.3]